MLTPTELVDAAAAAGLRALALTDHDTVAGLAEARAAAAGRLELVFGIELSCRMRKRNFHLLGYFFDPSHPGLVRLTEGLRAQRQARMAEMLERLRRLGISLPPLTVATPGRAHLARALVAQGVVADLEEAFQRYLGQGKKAYVQGAALQPWEAIETLHAAGGVAVLAHPGLNDALCLLDQLARLGLDGLEVYYPRHNREMTALLERESVRLQLLRTGGSDHHGPDHPALGSVALPPGTLEGLRARAGNLLGSVLLTHQKFLRQVKQLREAGARFLSFAVTESPGSEFELDYYFDHLGQVEQLKTRTEEQAAPSLIALFNYTDFPEREAFRQYRIKFLGNPNLVALSTPSS